jgi:hypothetical protein
MSNVIYVREWLNDMDEVFEQSAYYVMNVPVSQSIVDAVNNASFIGYNVQAHVVDIIEESAPVYHVDVAGRSYVVDGSEYEADENFVVKAVVSVA